MFSSRLPARLTSNTLSQAAARARASGADLIDLTETNPTAVGATYPADMLTPLSDPRSVRYQPHPLGLLDARAAVAAAYGAGGSTPPDPDRIVLTSSTSEAYSMLFKLLCDPDDEVLVPQPSYPLFDLLSRLDAVRPVPYRLDSCAAWALDRDSVLSALSPRTRAVLVVSPNNPTGSWLRAADRDWLVELARRHGLAIVADEVFAEYPLSPRVGAASLLDEPRVLTFTLGGLSKSAGLPQMKLAWMVVSGPSEDVREAIDRLEIVADTYLSVSTPVQTAAARLIDAGRSVRAAITARLAENLACLRAVGRAHPALTIDEPEGGWSAVIRVPAVQTEEQMALHLLQRERVLVHPGYFFDFAEEAYLVVSLLPVPRDFEQGVSRIGRAVDEAWR